MHLLLVRHGQSANNALRETQGRALGRTSEPELSDLGHEQARALGARLAQDSGVPERRVTRLLSSPMRRALATADHLADALGLPIELAPTAFESGGVYTEDATTGVRTSVAGTPIPDLLAAHPRLTYAGDPSLGWGPAAYEASEDDRLTRARALLAGLDAAHHDDPGIVVLVTHQHFSQYVIAAHLGLPARPSVYFRLSNTGTTLLVTGNAQDAADGDGSGDLVWCDRVDHLSPEQVSGMWT